MATEFKALVERARQVPVEAVIAQHGGIALRKSGQERIGPCPRCGGNDRFSINVKDNVWNCRGCKPDDVTGDVIGLVEFLYNLDFAAAVERLTGKTATKRGDKRRGNGGAGTHSTLGPIVARYDYVDETGALLFQVTRHEPKDFRQRKPDGHHGWISNTDGVRMVPYHLPELIEAIAQGQTIFIVEGEKDVDNVRALGAPATCNPRGAGKWGNCDIDQFFADAHVVIVADNDPQTRNKKTGELLFQEDGRPRFAGWDHAQDVAAHLSEVAASVRVIDLKKIWPGCPEKGDVTDWIAQGGGTIERLNDIAATAPEWSPDTAEVKRGVAIVRKENFVSGFRPLSYLVEGMLQRGFIYALTGATSHAKSAIALALAELVASPDRNAMFGKHHVEKGRVLYFVGENPDDIRMRVIGADSLRVDAQPERDELYFIVGQIEIEKHFHNIRDAVFAIGGVDLVIVDTSAAYFLGDEELSNTQMGGHARMLRKLTELPGNPCVLVLCHPIKHPQDWTQLLPRGGGAFLAEMDGNLTAWKHDEVLVDLNYTKMRGPGFEPMTLKLEVIHTTRLIDDKGRVLPTVRAVAVTDVEEDRQTDRTLDDENRVLVQMMYQPNQSFADIARALGWLNNADEPLKMRVQRAVTRLEKEKPILVRKLRGRRWELTDKGKEIAAQAARGMPIPEPKQEALL
jgi:AAA domain/CHC2 zinc finger